MDAIEAALADASSQLHFIADELAVDNIPLVRIELAEMVEFLSKLAVLRSSPPPGS